MFGKGLLAGVLSVAVLLVAACASLKVQDTTPLSASQLEPPGASEISRGGYRIDLTASLPDEAPDLLVLVAFSGGGKRSAAFGYGALRGMRDVMVPTRSGPRSLLSELTGMSGVSGGSFPAAYYGLYREAAFGKFEQDFLYQNTNGYIEGIYLLPWNWTWLVNPDVGTNDFMAHVYDETMFHGATFSALQQRGRPLVAIDATDLSYGMPFLFTQEMFDLICSDLDQFPIARAVAASNGFPGLFSPITLTDRARDCGGRKPGWLRAISPEQLHNPLSRVGHEGRMAERYLDPNEVRFVHLVDGGVADNLGLRAAGSLFRVATPEEIELRGFDKIRRLLVLSIDGEGSQDTALARQRIVGGLLSMILQASGAMIDNYNLDTLLVVGAQVQEFAKLIAKARCEKASVIDGAPCGDVEAALIHVSLSDLPDSPEKKQLLAIPTGLTIPREQVDLLIKAGQEAITGSPAVRSFFDRYRQPASPAVATNSRRIAVRN